MPDYQRMYTILCCAVDRVIEPLEAIPLARRSAWILRSALNAAEDVYIDTADNAPETAEKKTSV